MANYTKTTIGKESRIELHEKLSLTGAEISLNELPAGANVPFVHSHKENEEIYGILSGNGKAIIDGEEIILSTGDWLKIAPAAKRQFFASDISGITYAAEEGGSDRRHDGDPLDHCLQAAGHEAGDRQDPRRQERSRGQQTGGVQSGAGAWPPRRAGPPDCVRHDRRIPAELRRRFHRQSAGDQSGQDGGLPRRSGRGNADQAGCLIRQEKKEGRYRYAYYVRTRQVRKRSL